MSSMSSKVLFNQIIFSLILVIDYITYAYNAFLSILFHYFFNQQQLQVHKPSNTYHPAVLVTGTSAGIGRDTALTLVKKGYTVFATVRRKKDAQDLKNEYEAIITENNNNNSNNDQDRRLIPLIMDITKEKEINHVFDKIKEEIERKNIPFVGLINNASMIVYLPIDVTNKDCFKDTFETNVMGTINVTKKFMPLLRESHGRVINIGSIASWSGLPTMGIYSATKAAIGSLTRVWRMECRSFGVHFSLIEPGAVDTRFTEEQELIWKSFTNFDSLSSSSDMISKYYDSKHNLSSNVISTYENTNKMIAKRSNDIVSNAIPPLVVTDAILHALSSPYPKNTYYVGLDARVIAALNWVFGDRIVEAVVVKALSDVSNCNYISGSSSSSFEQQ